MEKLVIFHILNCQFIRQQKPVSRLHVVAEYFSLRSVAILLSVIIVVLEMATVTVLCGYPFHCL